VNDCDNVNYDRKAQRQYRPATIREARKTIEPSIVTAAVVCEQSGADGITVHLRGDRRHIQDRDIELLRDVVTTYLNVEMAATEEMTSIAVATRPDAVSLVPENPNEVTTEGGLDVVGNLDAVKAAIDKLRAADIFVSIFIDPDTAQIDAAKRAGAQQVELCTAEPPTAKVPRKPPPRYRASPPPPFTPYHSALSSPQAMA